MRIFPAASLRSESTTPATRVRRRRRQPRTRLVCRPTCVMTPLHGQVRGLNSFYMLLVQHIADRLTHSKCEIERLKQSRVTERRSEEHTSELQSHVNIV